MDPFEEFQFKPLTEGLGFHKKQEKLKEQVSKSGLVDEHLSAILPSSPKMEFKEDQIEPVRKRSYEDLLAALEKPVRTDFKKSPELEITEPLPRTKPNTNNPTPALETRAEIGSLSTHFNQVLERPTVGVRRGAADSPRSPALVPAAVSIASAILDGVVVFAMTLIFLVSLLMVTKVDLLNVVLNTKSDLATQFSLFVLFVAVMQMYVVVARSFFGRTLGEWTFDFQMGTNAQHQKGTYPLQVAWRSLVIVLSGLFLLPLLSWIFGKDLTAKITGIQLFQQKN